MNTQVTSASELAEKIEAKRYGYFTFPLLDITIKYRKPDLLKLSYAKSLPAAMASTIIEAYKEAVGGTTPEAFAQKAAEKTVSANDELVQDLSQKGYLLLEQLAVSHKFLNVPESDFSATPTPLISWNDIPEEDAIAFLLNLIQGAQAAQTVDGGEVTFDDVTEFPVSTREPKRRTAGKNG